MKKKEMRPGLEELKLLLGKFCQTVFNGAFTHTGLILWFLSDEYFFSVQSCFVPLSDRLCCPHKEEYNVLV